MEEYLKIHNYEKRNLITTTIVVLIVIEISTVLLLFKTKRFSYQKITGVITKENLITIIATKEERKKIYQNNKIYLNDKVFIYRIEEDRGFILKKNNIKYYEIIIITKTKLKQGMNDTVNMSIKDKKKTIIKMIKDIWVGDNN